MSIKPCFSHLERIVTLPNGEKVVDCAVTDLHRNTASSVIEGRNVIAGYPRGWGLQFDVLRSFVKQDPVFAESLHFTSGFRTIDENSLMNIFLIMKYGIKDRSGDFIDFGCYYGSSTIFIANVARRLGFTGKIYALDTFEGIPAVDEKVDFNVVGDFNEISFENFVGYLKMIGLTNVVPVKGRFEETATALLQQSEGILLAHIDCDVYPSVRYAISAVLSYMNPASGYLIFDDPLHGPRLGALQAVEEMIETHGLRAEQAYPQLVYRYPKLSTPEL